MEGPEAPRYARQIFVRNRKLQKSGNRGFRVWLPTEFNDVWEWLWRNGRKVDIIVVLREEPHGRVEERLFEIVEF